MIVRGPIQRELTHDEIRSHLVCVRAGPGANCSSIGSAVEMLFLSAALGAVVLTAITAALAPRRDATDETKKPTSEGSEEPTEPPAGS